MQVGLLTGDVIENRDAPDPGHDHRGAAQHAVQTPSTLDDVGCIIFDEIHYLADPERGTTWEEAIILCPRRHPAGLPVGHGANARRDRRLDRAHATARST